MCVRVCVAMLEVVSVFRSHEKLSLIAGMHSLHVTYQLFCGVAFKRVQALRAVQNF